MSESLVCWRNSGGIFFKLGRAVYKVVKASAVGYDEIENNETRDLLNADEDDIPKVYKQETKKSI